ncbi:MAG TPA: nuclear transport factor 2 family protein [Acidimicrobiales bacterium]|nr:nuclear transport factor 2 family protein [Acidimicrobiales bacterium]
MRDGSGLVRPVVDAWLLHPVAGAPEGEKELATLLACFNPDARYVDVPTGSVFEGHDGIRHMCQLAHHWSSDIEATVFTRQTDGTMFAFETEVTGTNDAALGDLPATGRPFVLEGVSVGTVDGDGLVTSQRDYWDLGSFLAQVGLLAST